MCETCIHKGLCKDEDNMRALQDKIKGLDVVKPLKAVISCDNHIVKSNYPVFR